MDGILVVNKEKDYTSRDVVNIVSKKLGTKKVGHTGTLDPIATGVLVLCVGKALKIVEDLMEHDKEYIATFILGYETDTLDITGKILYTKDISVSKEDIINVLKTYIGKQKQEVPKYSAIKVNGKKLYEYARNNIDVKLPIKDINIYNIELLNYNPSTKEVVIKCLVSKGTYIRSLIRDIGRSLNSYATMTNLQRTKVGNFSIDNSYTLEMIENDNFKLLKVEDLLPYEKVYVEDELLNKIKNGCILKPFFKNDKALIMDKNNNLIAIYKKDKDVVRVHKMF